SSRRRHTRCYRDWSSDVCSSDLMNQGYWAATLETLSLVLVATSTCVLIGVPLGIAAAHRPRLDAVLRPVLDLMQTLPTFVYLIRSEERRVGKECGTRKRWR